MAHHHRHDLSSVVYRPSSIVVVYRPSRSPIAFCFGTESSVLTFSAHDRRYHSSRSSTSPEGPTLGPFSTSSVFRSNELRPIAPHLRSIGPSLRSIARQRRSISVHWAKCFGLLFCYSPSSRVPLGRTYRVPLTLLTPGLAGLTSSPPGSH